MYRCGHYHSWYCSFSPAKPHISSFVTIFEILVEPLLFMYKMLYSKSVFSCYDTIVGFVGYEFNSFVFSTSDVSRRKGACFLENFIQIVETEWFLSCIRSCFRSCIFSTTRLWFISLFRLAIAEITSSLSYCSFPLTKADLYVIL